MSRILLSLIFAAAATVGRPQGQVGLKPFAIDYRGADPSSIDLSFLLDAPAGKDGPLAVAGGHLVQPNGKRVRLWGVNLTDFAAGSIRFPAKEDAAFWAATLARLGINCVRLHNLDVPAPKGLIAAGRTDTRELDPAQLDRLDYFVAALKARGIYADLNLNVGRSYKSGDGVRDFSLIGYAKTLTYFDPRLIELQKEYAVRLLTHYNPYTRSEYRTEPAVAIVEIVNENSLVGAWIRGRLAGTKTTGRPENWQDIPPYYAAELTRQYNQWLAATQPASRMAQLRAAAHVGPAEPLPRLVHSQNAAGERERFEAEAEFYMHLESRFFGDMRSFLKTTVGTRALLIGTSDFSYGKSDYPSLASRAGMDIVDAHGPWELAPMLDEPANSLPVRLSRSAIAGKPFTVSEHNHRFPGAYTCEGIPLLAAYGSFQDWDGIFLYTFELKPRDFPPTIGSRADLSFDPVKLANLAAGALLFLRADVHPALETIERSYSKEQVRQSVLVPIQAAGVYFTPGFSPLVALRHGSRISSFEGPPTQAMDVPDESPIVSDTGQLAWYYSPHSEPATAEDDQRFKRLGMADSDRAHDGVVTVDSERTEALIGFLGARKRAIAHLSADLRNRFASLVLSSLDSMPIAHSARLLLAATARVANGPGPTHSTLIEPVTGRVELRGLDRATEVDVFPLDGAGKPAGNAIRARRTDLGWEWTLGDVPTTWFEITVRRSRPDP